MLTKQITYIINRNSFYFNRDASQVTSAKREGRALTKCSKFKFILCTRPNCLHFAGCSVAIIP